MAKKKSKGLGDSIEKVTKATGIDKLVKFVAGEDCGCDERKEKLNKLFPYNSSIECLDEQEYSILHDWFSEERNSVAPSEQAELRKIYNRVFNKNSSPTSCGSCVRDMVDRLRQVYYEYEKN
jgi:hypothetical protein